MRGLGTVAGIDVVFDESLLTGCKHDGNLLTNIKIYPPTRMTRSELIVRLSQRFKPLTLSDAELSVKAILDAISDTVAEGGRVEIRGFGSFSVTIRPPRIARNPKTGERVEVPATAAPHFKPGKELRDRVNKLG
jgi:integration host factor subunit beta